MLPPDQRLRILVLGYIVRRPLGGGTWPTLQYALGLKQLGHDVWFFEDSEDYPGCYDPTRHVTDEDPTYGLSYATKVFDRVGLGERWAFYDAHQQQWHGPNGADALAICKQADLLIAPSSRLRPWTLEVPKRAFVDLDPVFEQIRLLKDEARRQELDEYTSFFTVGPNLATDPNPAIPSDGRVWHPATPPVVLDQWPVTPGNKDGNLTSVLQWHAFKEAEWQGQVYGMKSKSFPHYFELPTRTTTGLELALGGPDAPRPTFRKNGWHIADPLAVTLDPWTYQDYLAQSKGEFTVAKHGYVITNCGWFSERSAHYLASGRPVITEDTGFGSWLPVGDGLLSFTDPESALVAIEELDRNYESHCKAARQIAEEHFDAGRSLTRIVDVAMR